MLTGHTLFGTVDGIMSSIHICGHFQVFENEGGADKYIGKIHMTLDGH